MKPIDFLGTVSEGTARPEKLLPRLLKVLYDHYPEYFINKPDIKRDIEEVFEMIHNGIIVEQSVLWLANKIIAKLFDVLDEIAPNGYYFGPHKDDNLNIGYWPIPENGEDDEG